MALQCYPSGPIPASLPAPVAIQLERGARADPGTKHTAWIRERGAYEQRKSPDAEEVVLYGYDGLLEGLISNLFVVVDGVFYTAPATRVLDGQARSDVLAACRTMGIPVREEPPPLPAERAWDGAFLTSTGKLVKPVDRVRVGETGEVVAVAADGALLRTMQELYTALLELFEEPARPGEGA